MYRDWNGGAWSLEQTGPDLGGTPSVVQLQPTASAGGIHVGVLSATSGNLHVALWNGSTVEAATLLEVDVSSGDLVEAFMGDGP